MRYDDESQGDDDDDEGPCSQEKASFRDPPRKTTLYVASYGAFCMGGAAMTLLLF